MLLLSLVLLTNCASVRVPNFNVYATLPASKDGVKVNVLSGSYVRIPAKEWERLERRTVKLMPEDYAVIKKAFYSQCIQFRCAQELDLISHVFENIDAGLSQIQGK